jgi:hypothetical protein
MHCINSDSDFVLISDCDHGVSVVSSLNET